MSRITTTREFSMAALDVLGVDYKANPVLGVAVDIQNGATVEIVVRFAVPYGLLSRIDMAMHGKAGAQA